MSFPFIANLIILLSVLGILVIFLRRIPEVVQENGQLQFASTGKGSRSSGGFLSALGKSFVGLFAALLRPVWHFMLEAKDLKQGQILASKFASFVKPKVKIVNVGAFNSIRKADRLFKEGQEEEAEQTYIQVIRKYPHEYSAFEGLVKIYFKQKKFDDTMEILEFLVSHNPTNDLYLAQLGNAYLSVRRYTDAIKVYEKSLELNSLVPARFVNLGLAQQGAGKLSVARDNFHKAVDLDPSNMQYLMIFVDALEKLQDKDAAVEALNAAKERYPENREIQERLEEIQ
ncbi:MAG: hypothetical protein NVSMB66_4860 [Candidatus Doudnabacteria bacterium]